MANILTKIFSKKNRKWLLAVLGIVVIGFFGVRYLVARRTALPKGFASGNGRIEAKEVDIAAKLPLRVKEILVAEGDLVKPGQVVVRMDTVTLDSQLAEAKEKLAAAQESLAVAEAGITKQQSQIELARIEKRRSQRLVAERAGSQREYDVRRMAVKSTTAGLAQEKAKLDVAQKEVLVALANVRTVQSQIDDATLQSPVLGRVLYRLAEPGEVLGPGGKALTLVNLEDVYMEIFLPSNQAAAVKLGSEARFTVDYEPNRVGVGYVSFVSPQAQFTPKEVETKSEREKTGVRGVGYVRLNESLPWPKWLDKNLVRATQKPRMEAMEP